ncbi:hypothetical protein ACFQHK_15535 [Halomarina ordinaria]|uniref:Uncharacterized protein n=1 Tax=Halomarina ordinaria TaxID=3033939 RepID=A0ABD5UEY8_9EURY
MDERVDEEIVVEETLEIRPSVEQEIQAKVGANHPDRMVVAGEERVYGVPLEQEECIRVREEELAYISAQATFGTQEGRPSGPTRWSKRRADGVMSEQSTPKRSCRERTLAR